MQSPRAPSLMTTAGETLTAFEFPRLAASFPALALQPRGSGEPVVVLPGLGTSNSSTLVIRRYLSWLGYRVQGWNQGTNGGDVEALLPLVTEEVRRVHAETGQTVTLLGWSLGGVLAREVARDEPNMVRQVVTLGSPVVGGPKYTAVGRLYEQRGVDLDELEATIAAREEVPISVPVTSIYSRRDGIVGWRASIDRCTPDVDNVEVSTTHFGFGFSPKVLKILARKLAEG